MMHVASASADLAWAASTHTRIFSTQHCTEHCTQHYISAMVHVSHLLLTVFGFMVGSCTD
jgi:hypothetical protein